MPFESESRSLVPKAKDNNKKVLLSSRWPLMGDGLTIFFQQAKSHLERLVYSLWDSLSLLGQLIVGLENRGWACVLWGATTFV